ncbi:hypothetical protein GH714_003256 [Hevea brasiliensis]|uniref:protein-serine/threonine phosphatase n=1 Tax=Hevea brasiliensis TaxID=3981 RepID=A0A6A6KCZ1_HEVBR|nr:hypothetical protein GH714_003256 [Hevea brasiliensis]
MDVGDLDRPLVSDGVESNESARNYDLEGAYVVSEPTEDVSVGQTLKRIFPTEHPAEVQTQVRQENQSSLLGSSLENDAFQEFVPKVITDQRSCLSLEVISGPSRGLLCSIQSTSSSRLPLTLGRVSCDLLLKDSEVSGKHAMINWNIDKKKWELVDMGSLNGTLLNSQPINHPDSGSRHCSDPVELTNGDIITVGKTSNIYVHVTSKSENKTPFGVGLASDPMALRRGGKKLAMEDVCYYQWPLPGIDKFGVFGICDGHGGVAAANSASKMLPEKVASILSDSLTRERVLLQCDASEVLRVAFSQTEASMNNDYEGCTATVLLVWADGDENFFAQCANLGDSACVMNVDGKQIKMTEDHRVTSYSEKLRIGEIEPLKDGDTRLCGLNLARMLGDKFLKRQDARFSSEPYISEAVHIHRASSTFALLASDGFWDVICVRKAVQLVLQTRERYSTDGENSAEKLAGQIARAATIFRIDEVVVFDDKSNSVNEHPTVNTGSNSDDSESGAAFLVRILRYLETPQYLRKALFPKHNSLRFVGLLPPLDAPHHLRKHEWAPYREGVTLKEKATNFQGTPVDVGLSKNVVIDQVLEPGIRVTVLMGTNRNLDADLPRQVVSLSKPKKEAGIYWGYRVRYASNISSVFNACPYEGGYDYLIGTSEHGQIINSSELSLPIFRHLLIAFGGLSGLEESIEEDSNLEGKNVRDVFDSYLNTCLIKEVEQFEQRKQFSSRFNISKSPLTEHCKEYNFNVSLQLAKINGFSSLDIWSLSVVSIHKILELVADNRKDRFIK